jgi:hypothetical protein
MIIRQISEGAILLKKYVIFSVFIPFGRRNWVMSHLQPGLANPKSGLEVLFELSR